jgi:hypothetical protein
VIVPDTGDEEDDMSNAIASNKAQAARATNVALWVLQA